MAKDFFDSIASKYSHVVTIEDGLIGTPASGLRGFAGLVATNLERAGITMDHLGIVDPAVAPSETFDKVWDHFGMTEANLVRALMERR